MTLRILLPMADEQPPLWRRQPGEPMRAYAAFCFYRNLGPERSLNKMAQAKAKSQLSRKRAATGALQDVAKLWRWVERAQAWDDYLDRQSEIDHVQAVKDMRKRHAAAAVIFQEKALQRLETLPLEELNPLDVLRFFSESVKIERLSRGEPDTVSEQRQKDAKQDKNQDLFSKAANDPAVAELVCQLFERVAACQE